LLETNRSTTKASRALPLALLLLFTTALAPARPAFALQSQATASSTAAAPAPALTEAERELAARVRTETIKEVTAALSAPEMQGRGTGQPGGDAAAKYIAERFSKLGLKPLGDKGSYQQAIKFREYRLAPETSFAAGDAQLKMGDDFVFTPPMNGDEDVSGPMVFVTYGLRVPSMKRDDLKNMDLRGKVVVLLQGPPKGVSESDWKKARASLYVVRTLLAEGAAAIVFANTSTEEMPYATLADYLTRRQVERADEEQPPAELPPFIYVSDAGAEKLFAGSGTTYAQARERAERGEFASQELKLTAKIKLRRQEAKVTGSNVVGYLEGSDPKLKEEAVVYSAHYDAWGATADGRFYAGAADNALGVGEMVSMAEALVGSPAKPRRSVVFLAVTGEEYGLHGSEFWVKNPTWKIKQVAADLNFDGMGTEIRGPLKKIVGFGAEHSELGALLASVAQAVGGVVVPDPMPEEKSFYRSDHYAFVKRGVPALMLMGSPDVDAAALVADVKGYEKTRYHQPSDVVTADWNWEGPAGLARLGVVMGLRVANADAMPAWLPASPFNRKRGTDEPPPPEP
jgi:Zn-dependent M28 family amino/carboxypeptidase